MFAVEHMREVLDRLQRGYARRAALGTRAGAAEDDALRALEDFSRSLPRHERGTRKLLIAVQIVVIAQVLSAVIGEAERLYPIAGAKRTVLLDALGQLANLNVANLVKVARVITDAGVVGAALVVGIAGLAAWLALLRTAREFRVVRAIRNEKGGDSLRRGEEELLAAVGEKPPRESTFDLAVAALLPGAALLIAFILGREYFAGIPNTIWSFGSEWSGVMVAYIQPPKLLILAASIGCAAAARLAQLALGYQRRVRAWSWRPLRRRWAYPPRFILVLSSLLWSALAAGLVLVTFSEYAQHDTKPAEASLVMTTRNSRVLKTGKLTLRLTCSEPCGFGSATVPRRKGRGLQSQLGEPLTRDPRHVARISGPGRSVRAGQLVLGLERSQLRWLRRQIHSGVPWFDISILDKAGNRTKLQLLMSPQ